MFLLKSRIGDDGIRKKYNSEKDIKNQGNVCRVQEKDRIMKVNTVSKGLLFWAVTLAATFFSACSLPRNPVPLAQISDGQPVGFPSVRYWESEYRPDVRAGQDKYSDCSVLALSGGGANGAFGSGFLSGWTASGTRPHFRVVTGISTGSLTAPLAFLGSEYDKKLEEYYTTVKTRDILDVQGILGFGFLPVLLGESYASTKPLQRLIEQLVDQAVLDAVAAEHAKGRRLYIGTTNLDAQRLMVWDMGRIAGSGHPDALKMFRKVMLASASIPGAFPPVYFDVEADGRKYDEMHVDGGVITEVFGYGKLFSAQTYNAETDGPCSIYVIRNGMLDTEPMQVPRRVLKIGIRSFGTLMKAHSWEDMFRMYFIALETNVDYNYVSLPHGYESHGKEMFDPVEMKRLFDLGFNMAKNGYNWNKVPPPMRAPSEDQWLWTPAFEN